MPEGQALTHWRRTAKSSFTRGQVPTVPHQIDTQLTPEQRITYNQNQIIRCQQGQLPVTPSEWLAECQLRHTPNNRAKVLWDAVESQREAALKPPGLNLPADLSELTYGQYEEIRRRLGNA